MAYIVVAIVAGLAIGLARGGSLRNLAGVRFRWWALLVLGAALQLAAELRDVPSITVIVSYACLIAFALRNLGLRGMGVVTIGIVLNAVVITVNGGMPVKERAIVAAGLADTVAEARQFDFGGKRHLATSDDSLVFLGDVIPVPIGEGEVLSYGDLVLALGAAALLANLLQGRQSRRGVDAVNHMRHILNSSNRGADREIGPDGGDRTLATEQRKGHQGLVARQQTSGAH